MIPGVRLIMLGRQGAGKGTQCVRLSRHYVVPHISTGDMLRAAVREATPVGKRAQAIMDSGRLVPDEVIIGVVDERLSKDDSRTRGFILDGFPRTVPQAEALVEITRAKPIDLCVDLDVPRDLVLQRLAARRVCNVCGHIYAATGHEPNPWICDFCGGDVLQRADDTEEAINQRLDLYETQTTPLLSFYKARDELAVVDGVGGTNDVLRRLVTAIETNRGVRR